MKKKAIIFFFLVIAVVINCGNKTDDMQGQKQYKKLCNSIFQHAYSVRQASDGGYIIAGWSNSFDGNQYDVYLIKTDSKGDCVWAKTFYGKEDDAGWSVQQTTDKGYIIAGNTNSFGVGNKDIYIIKTDANGDCVWTRTFGSKNNDGAYSAEQTKDGGYIIAGSTNLNGNKGNDYAYLIKLDANGNRQW